MQRALVTVGLILLIQQQIPETGGGLRIDVKEPGLGIEAGSHPVGGPIHICLHQDAIPLWLLFGLTNQQ
jgi:hypothetical protein